MIMLSIGISSSSDSCLTLDSNKTWIDHLIAKCYFSNSTMALKVIFYEKHGHEVSHGPLMGKDTVLCDT